MIRHQPERMRVMHRLISGLMLMLILIVFIYPAPGTGESIQKKFIIGGWVGPHQTEEQYLLFKQAGFNTVLDYPFEGDKYQKTLELAQKVGGLDVILNIDHQFLRYKPEPFVPFARIAAFVKQVKGNKNIIGYMMFDEPRSTDVELLVAAEKHVRSLDPARLTWLDFHPDSAGGLAHSILEKMKPSVISFAYYPYCTKSDQLDQFYTLTGKYRNLSIEFGKPLWLFVQSASWPWFQDRNEDRRLPTPSDIRMQVYSDLAYGAKALWYYTYVTPRHAKEISSAILDNDDKVKTSYAGIKAINAEVQALAPVLMTLDSVDVMHVKPKHKGVKPFTPNNVIADIQAENLLIGYFKDSAGIDYFMLVNKLPNALNKNIKLKLGGKVKNLSQIDRKTGRAAKYAVSGGTAEVTLDPGDGILFKVN